MGNYNGSADGISNDCPIKYPFFLSEGLQNIVANG